MAGTMKAALVRVATAIAEEITAAGFDGMRVKAERSYADWQEILEEIDGELHCDVVPVIHRDAELADRSTVKYRCDVDVGIRKRFLSTSRDCEGRVPKAEVDRLVLLVELVNEYFIGLGNGRKLKSYPDAVWVESKIRQTFVRKHLLENKQFTAIIRLTYDVFR